MDDHKKLFVALVDELKPIFDNSTQSVYVFFDDEFKACNKNFASLLGYATPIEWAKIEESFPVAFVAEKSRKTLVETYQRAMENFVGKKIMVSWKKKSGGIVNTEVILVPITFRNHSFALHFIDKI